MKKILTKGLRRIVPVAFVLLLVFQAAACSGNAKLVFSGELEPVKGALLSAQKAVIDGGRISTVSESFKDDSLVLLVSEDGEPKYGLYDMKTKVNYGLKYDSCKNIKHGIGIMGIKTAQSEFDIKYGAVNSKDEVIFPLDYEYDEIYFASAPWENCIVVKDRYYDVSSGHPVLFDNIKNITNINSVHKSDKYFYGFGSSGVYIFDLQANFIKFFEETDSSNFSRQVFVMGGDNILIQSTTALPFGTDEKYDFSTSFSKFRLKTEVYNLRTNKTKIVDFDYLINNTESNNTLEDNWRIYNKSMKNMTVLNITRISDKTITGLGQDDLCVVVDGNLKIQYEIPQNATSVRKIAEDRFIIWGGYEGGFITNGNGTVLTSLGIGVRFCAASGGLVVVNNGSKYGIIDADGRIVLPYEYDFISDFYGNAFARKSIGNYDYTYYTIDRQGTAKELEYIDFAYFALNFTDGFYITQKYDAYTESTYIVYNYCGDKLLTFYSPPLAYKTDGYLLIGGQEPSGHTVYYILSQEVAVPSVLTLT